CFWCTEAIYQMLPGVKSVTSGYAGGTKETPTYQQVCTGDTGHAEVIQVEFDPKRSEEHTSELQSRFDLVCRLLLEKKKNKSIQSTGRVSTAAPTATKLADMPNRPARKTGLRHSQSNTLDLTTSGIVTQFNKP